MKIMGSVKTSAEIAAKQAKVKKLELTDLRDALVKLGEALFTQGIGREEWGEHFAAVEALDEEIEAKRQTETLSDAATAVDKAKHAATVAKDRALVEALLVRRKNALAALGEASQGYEIDDAAIGDLQQKVQVIRDDVDTVKGEIAQLKDGENGAAASRILLVAAVVLALVIVGAIVGKVKQRKELRMVVQESLNDAGESVGLMQLEIVEMEREAKALALENEKMVQEAAMDRQREEAEERVEAERRKLERQRERDKALAEREAKERARERLAAEEAEKKRLEKLAAEEKARKDKIKEQAERARYAAEVFAEINVTPRFVGNQKVAASGATYEIKTRDLDWNKVQQLHQEGDWLTLMGMLNRAPYQEYPSASEIEVNAGRLGRYRCQILCRTRLKETSDAQLRLICMPMDDDNRAIDVCYRSWTSHPDGIGYLKEWSPEDGDCLVLLWDERLNSQEPIYGMQKAFADAAKALKLKRELGELTQNEHRERLTKLKEKAHIAVMAWVKSH